MLGGSTNTNWDDSCSPGETPGRTNLGPPDVDNNHGIAYSFGYSRNGLEPRENSMYLDHDYTYDEYGSRSIFTELHDGEVPVPYEQTGNMCVVSTTYPMPTSSSSSSSSSSPTSASSSSFMGPGNGIFQTVMRGYHGNSLFSNSNGTGDNNNTNANASNKNNTDNGNNFSEGRSTGTKDCLPVSHHSAQVNVQQDRGEEFIDLFRLRLGEKDAHSYLNPKNADKPVSILDPYNVDCMVDLFQRAKV